MCAQAIVAAHPVVSKAQWLRARRELLDKEKELTRLGDELTRQRQALPWTRVETEYQFLSPRGMLTLGDLFDGCSQLATYHFMFGPDWEEGCPGCSYVTDHIDGALEHLRARDVSLVLVSRGPLDKLMAFRKRMGWHTPWVSSAATGFNHDFGVTFTAVEVSSGAKSYNFGSSAPHGEENPGLSFFSKDPSGAVFHTYSTYGRGLDVLLGAYAILDRTPQGRDESGLPTTMAWLRHHDKYSPAVRSIGSCCHETPKD